MHELRRCYRKVFVDNVKVRTVQLPNRCDLTRDSADDIRVLNRSPHLIRQGRRLMLQITFQRIRLIAFVILFVGCASIGRTAAHADAQDAAGRPIEAREQRADRRPRPRIESTLSHGDGLTFGTARASLAAMLPIDPPKRMLLVNPTIAAHTLDAPVETPSRLYSAGVHMMWMERLKDDMRLTIAVNPSVSGDDAEFGRQVRVFAMGAVAWDWIPDELRLTAGAAWLGRRDIGVVPAAGLEWTPSDDWNVSLILPRPRVSKRLASSETSETWIYAAGAINGGTFDVRRSDGAVDELSIREFAATIGLELKSEQVDRGFCEIGAGFGRELQFERTQKSIDFGPGIVLRLGLTR